MSRTSRSFLSVQVHVIMIVVKLSIRRTMLFWFACLIWFWILLLFLCIHYIYVTRIVSLPLVLSLRLLRMRGIYYILLHGTEKPKLNARYKLNCERTRQQHHGSPAHRRLTRSTRPTTARAAACAHTIHLGEFRFHIISVSQLGGWMDGWCCIWRDAIHEKNPIFCLLTFISLSLSFVPLSLLLSGICRW